MNNDGNILDFSNWKLVVIEVIKNEEYLGNRAYYVYSDGLDVEALGDDKEVVAAFINSDLGKITISDPNDADHEVLCNNKKLVSILNNTDEDNYLDWLYCEVDTDGLMEPLHYDLSNFVVINSDKSIKQLDEELWHLMY